MGGKEDVPLSVHQKFPNFFFFFFFAQMVVISFDCRIENITIESEMRSFDMLQQ